MKVNHLKASEYPCDFTSSSIRSTANLTFLIIVGSRVATYLSEKWADANFLSWPWVYGSLIWNILRTVRPVN